MFKKIFQSKNKTSKSIKEMEQQKRDMELQLKLLTELEEKIKRQQLENNS